MWNLWKSSENGGSQIPKLYVVSSIPIARSNLKLFHIAIPRLRRRAAAAYESPRLFVT
jgi:hypothetical protein